MNRTLALLFLSVGACSGGQENSGAGANQTSTIPTVQNESAGTDRYECGGETDLATVERYFSDLEKALAQPGPLRRFNRFVGTRLAIFNGHGRSLYFHVEDIGSVTPGRITIQEWQEINRRGERSLHGAGYRGCFMDNGKVWFEASEEEGFRLVSIAKDMPWVTIADGASNH